jgi:predicted transcriptional regulator
MIDKYQFKILIYINSHRTKTDLTINDISSKFENKNGVTRKDIIEIVDSLRKQEYIKYVGINYNVVTTHKGRMYIKTYRFHKLKDFIKNYIYPIFVATIECIITYLLATNQ